MSKRNILVACLVVLSAFLAASLIAEAQEWPTRPISIYVGFPPGGPVDVATRAYAPAMSKELGVPVVVVNKPGANGMVCAEYVANAKPDGYTLQEWNLAVIVVGKHTVDTTVAPRDFTYILGHTGFNYALVVGKDAPWKDFQGWVEYARKNPTTKFGTFGPASFGHFTITWISKREGINVIKAVFKGDGEGLPALMGGHIDMLFAGGAQIPLIQGGKLRTILSLTGKLVDAGAVQTLDQVYPDFPKYLKTILESPAGMVGPKGIPAPIAQKLTAALRKAIQSEEYGNYLKQSGRPITLWEPGEILPRLESADKGFGAVAKEYGIEKQK